MGIKSTKIQPAGDTPHYPALFRLRSRPECVVMFTSLKVGVAFYDSAVGYGREYDGWIAHTDSDVWERVSSVTLESV